MTSLGRLSEPELDRLFAGVAPAADGELEQLAAYLRDVKAACLQAPAETTAARHLAAVAKTARLLPDAGEAPASHTTNGWEPEGRAVSEERWSLRMSRKRLGLLTAKVAGASALAMALTAGLAFAGVDLPSQVDAVFDRIGITLPEEANEAEAPGGTDVADDGVLRGAAGRVEGAVQGTGRPEGAGKPDDAGRPEGAGKPEGTGSDVSQFVHNWEGEKGCEFGQAVSEFASQNSQEHRQDGEHSNRIEDPCARDEERETPRGGQDDEEGSTEGGAQGGQASSSGRSTAATASGGRAGGNGGR